MFNCMDPRLDGRRTSKATFCATIKDDPPHLDDKRWGAKAAEEPMAPSVKTTCTQENLIRQHTNLPFYLKRQISKLPTNKIYMYRCIDRAVWTHRYDLFLLLPYMYFFSCLAHHVKRHRTKDCFHGSQNVASKISMNIPKQISMNDTYDSLSHSVSNNETRTS